MPRFPVLRPLLVSLCIVALAAGSATAQEAPPDPCATEGHRQFDFWIGSWIVYGPGGDVAGRNEITEDLGGCVLREHWHGGSGLEGRSVNLFRGDGHGWHQTWVDSAGSLLRIDGGLEEGRMVMTGREPSRREPDVMVDHRIAWEPLPGRMVYQRWRASKDDGATWVPLFDGLYVRGGAEAAIVDAPGETGQIQVAPGVELHYRVLGEGPPLVVANGRITRGVAALGESHRLVLYDPRGRGRSTPWTEEMELTLDTELADLEAVLDHLEIDRASLLGVSYYGGLVALYAAKRPERVERIVMIGPIAPTAEQFTTRAVVTDSRKTAESEALATLEAQGAAETDPIGHCLAWQRAHVHDLVADPASYTSDHSSCWLPNERPPSVLAWSRALFATVGSWDWTGRAAAVAAPTLVIYGTGDRITPPEGARAWGDLIPAARVLPVENAGHLPLAERPEVVVEEIREFLGGA